MSNWEFYKKEIKNLWSQGGILRKYSPPLWLFLMLLATLFVTLLMSVGFACEDKEFSRQAEEFMEKHLKDVDEKLKKLTKKT